MKFASSFIRALVRRSSCVGGCVFLLAGCASQPAAPIALPAAVQQVCLPLASWTAAQQDEMRKEYDALSKTAIRAGFGTGYVHYTRAGSGDILAINAPQAQFAAVTQIKPTKKRVFGFSFSSKEAFQAALVRPRGGKTAEARDRISGRVA